MGLVSKSIPNLINGISQQPDELRLESQGEIQENGLSDVVDGLKKRPPAKFIKKLVKTKSSYTTGVLTTGNTEPLDVSDCYITTYKRSETEQYTVVIKPHASTPVIYVYDQNGNLNYESGAGSWDWSSGSCVFVKTNTDDTSYLAETNGTKNDITSTSVSDYTFIVNKKKVVEQDPVVEPKETGYKALVYLKSVNYSRNYRVKVTSKKDNTETLAAHAQTSAGNSANTTDETQLRVGEVIKKLTGDVGSFGLKDDLNMISTGSYSNAIAAYPESVPFTTNQFDGTAQTLRLNDTCTNTFYNNARVFNIVEPSNGQFPTDITVLVGNSIIPYAGSTAQAVVDNASATDSYISKAPTDGWVFNKHVTANAQERGAILLPQNAMSKTSGQEYTYPAPYRGYTEVYNTSSITYNAFISPSPNDDEPYFVITTTEDGQIGDFNIQVTDDDGGSNLKAFKDNAKSFTDLPNQCVSGYRIKVAGDNNQKEDDFYVVFTGTGGSGVWRETVAPNLKNNFNKATLPHTLKQLRDSSSNNLYFEFTQGSNEEGKGWSPRMAGDDDSNPFPSLLNQTISDIFFHRSRLGIISGENVIFSETNNFFNFFRTTVRTLLDTDPIIV